MNSCSPALRTVSNVYSFVANVTGYTNVDVPADQMPLTNLTGVFNGPLNANQYVPFTAPNMSAVGAGGQGVFVADSLNTSFTPAVAPAPVNLTALNETVPASGPPNATTSGAPAPSGSGSGSSSGAMGLKAAKGVVVVGPAGGSVVLGFWR